MVDVMALPDVPRIWPSRPGQGIFWSVPAMASLIDGTSRAIENTTMMMMYGRSAMPIRLLVSSRVGAGAPTLVEPAPPPLPAPSRGSLISPSAPAAGVRRPARRGARAPPVASPVAGVLAPAVRAAGGVQALLLASVLRQGRDGLSRAGRLPDPQEGDGGAGGGQGGGEAGQ